MSNILDLFKPASQATANSPGQDPTTQEDCLGCLTMAAGVMSIGGAYLFSGAVFYNKGKPLPGVTPGYKMAVRGAGVPVFLFGLYRGWQAWELAQKDGVKW